MDAILAFAAVLTLFALFALPSLVGLAIERRITRQLRTAARARDTEGRHDRWHPAA